MAYIIYLSDVSTAGPQAVFAVRKTGDVDPIGVNITMTPAPLEENPFAKAIAA